MVHTSDWPLQLCVHWITITPLIYFQNKSFITLQCYVNSKRGFSEEITSCYTRWIILFFMLSNIDLFIVDSQRKNLWIRIFTPDCFLCGICMSRRRLGRFSPSISCHSPNILTPLGFCILAVFFVSPGSLSVKYKKKWFPFGRTTKKTETWAGQTAMRHWRRYRPDRDD